MDEIKLVVILSMCLVLAVFFASAAFSACSPVTNIPRQSDAVRFAPMWTFPDGVTCFGLDPKRHSPNVECVSGER